MKKKRVCIVTGSRAEYGLLRALMREVKASSKLELKTVVTGMHLSGAFGGTIREIQNDGFRVDAKVPMTSKEDTSSAMAKSAGIGIIGMVRAFKKIRPDVVVVLGDRIEALAAAIASVYMNIPLAHIHGGDSARAGLDENARHAITKLAHIHFAATKKSAARILKLGEPSSRIHVVGAPGLDEMVKGHKTSFKELSKKFSIKSPFALLVQHPVSTTPESAAAEMDHTLRALAALRIQTVISYPNSDAGGRAMIEVIKKYVSKYPFFHARPNISREDFLGLMAHASVMLGNSSSGIIESSHFGVPVVNIGERQKGRERADNVIDAPHDAKKITAALMRALTRAFRSRAAKAKNPYGQGGAAKLIARVLEKLPPKETLLQKQITY